VETTNEQRRKTLMRLGWVAGAAALGQGLAACQQDEKEQPQPAQPSLEWGTMAAVFPYSTEFVYTLRWTAKELEKVKLSFKREDDTEFSPLAEVNAADGSYNWVLTGVLEEVTLKIASLDGKLEKVLNVKFQRLSGEVINIASYPTLLQVGGVSIVSNGATGELFIRRKTLVEFIVVAAWCTHAGCMVEDNPGQGIICNCHGSTFTQTGQVTQGPAMFDLQLFQSTYYPEQNKLIVVP
jgi:Rieske Fe-S protein